jgi:hypothetical protein
MKSPLFIDEIRVNNRINQRVFPIVKPTVAANAKAADATLTTSDLDTNITNTGASATVTLTLPAVANCKNRMISAYLTVAQILRFDANSTEAIYLAGSGVAGKYVQVAGVIGNYINLYCDGTQWLVLSYSGVVTKEA